MFTHPTSHATISLQLTLQTSLSLARCQSYYTSDRDNILPTNDSELLWTHLTNVPHSLTKLFKQF